MEVVSCHSPIVMDNRRAVGGTAIANWSSLARWKMLSKTQIHAGCGRVTGHHCWAENKIQL